MSRAPPPRQSLHAAPQTEPADRRFEPLDPSELPAVGVASEDAQTLYETAVVDEPTNPCILECSTKVRPKKKENVPDSKRKKKTVFHPVCGRLGNHWDAPGYLGTP